MVQQHHQNWPVLVYFISNTIKNKQLAISLQVIITMPGEGDYCN
jgi:hypothetical protein